MLNSALLRDKRCIAAVEFAITCPLLVTVLAGLADFPLAFWKRSLIETGVSNGATYAFEQMQANLNNGQSISTSTIAAIVQTSIDLAGLSVSVSNPATKCQSYDQTTTPPTTTLTAVSAGTTCSNGSLPGTYITITASYTYTPMMPFFSAATSNQITQTANVRVY